MNDVGCLAAVVVAASQSMFDDFFGVEYVMLEQQLLAVRLSLSLSLAVLRTYPQRSITVPLLCVFAAAAAAVSTAAQHQHQATKCAISVFASVCRLLIRLPCGTILPVATGIGSNFECLFFLVRVFFRLCFFPCWHCYHTERQIGMNLRMFAGISRRRRRRVWENSHANAELDG